MTPTTQTIQDQAVMIVESDIPADLTIAEYRARRQQGPSRWERARVALLGAGVVGLLAETVRAHRAPR